MNPGDPGHRRVPRIRATNVRAARRLEAERIVVLVKKVVSPSRIGAERGIVVHGTQRQRRAAPPAAHHLGGEQLLVLGAARLLLEEAAKRADALVQLAEGNVGPVAAEQLWNSLLHAAELVGIANDELARLARPLPVQARDAAPLDGGVADAVSETKGPLLRRQRVTILPPDRRDA